MPEKNTITALQDSQLFQNFPGSSTTDGEKRYEDRLRRALLIDPHTLSSPIA